MGSNCDVLRAPTLILCAMAIACSSAKIPARSDPTAPARLAAADALVRDGCFDCLVDAHREYLALRPVASVAEAAAAGAVRTAALLAIRERDLGTEDSGYLKRAQELLAGADTALQLALAPLLEIADTLPVRGAARQVAEDVELARMQAANRHRETWTAALRDGADADALSAYVWLAFNCAYVPASQQAVDEWLGVMPVWRETPLVRFKAATCGSMDRGTLEHLLDANPRFREIDYHLALSAALRGKIDEAMERLLRSYAWRPRWPSVTQSLANDYVAVEEFDSAVEFFDKTLAVVPAYADAMLGKARALTYAGRHDEALAVIDQMLTGHWLIGDARYWRALNDAQLGRNEEAWSDVELAAKLLVNAEVPKLAGLIAYRLKQIEVSRAKFEESRERNPDDCETGYYLGLVLDEQGVWSRAAEVLIETDRCLQNAERSLEAEIASLRSSTQSPERRDRQIARRERQIANGRRMMTTSWFNIAVAYYNLARKDDARQYAEKLAADDQFGDRARDLLSRLR